MKKRLLLHVCCAPCSTIAIERLKTNYDLTGYFVNPNIHPYEEYRNRREETKKYFTRMGLELLLPSKYDADYWFMETKGLEDEVEGGKRCPICFNIRLQKTAELAKELGFDFFATTLTVSPQKNAESINELGATIAQKENIPYLATDFKKQDGFKQSVELSKKHGLYRQDYCGCVFSRAAAAKRRARFKPEEEFDY